MSRRGPRSVTSSAECRSRSALGHHESLPGEDTSLFGSPVDIPRRPSTSMSYRGPRNGRSKAEESSLYRESAVSLLRTGSSRPPTSMSFSERVLEEADRSLSSRMSDPLYEPETDLTPTNPRPPSRYSMTSSHSVTSSHDPEEEVDDKYLEYRRRHFTVEGDARREARKHRLPEYDNELLEKYQRSFVRQADILNLDTCSGVKKFTVKGTEAAPLRGEHVWDTFPTVEDLDGCYLVEKQFEVAVDPSSDVPELADWMGLYHGEDGVYMLNKGLSRMPITGKSCVNKVDRIRDGVRMVLVYRPRDFRFHDTREASCPPEFGFQVTVMDAGVYVTHLEREGAAVRAGLKYGDQVLRVGQIYCSGMLEGAVGDLIRASGDELVLFVRDRPNEKMYTLLKDSTGYFGFRIRSAEVIEVIPGSSASRNGVPTNHFLTEVNGQNVLGWDDDKIRVQMDLAADDGAVSITLLHERAYKDFIKDLGAALFATMDHSMNFTLPLPKVNVESVFWNPASIFNTVTENTSIEN